MTWDDIFGMEWIRAAPFFIRFKEPTDVQQRAIPEILRGKSCLVIAPTASGKTEAIIAPLIMRLEPLSLVGGGRSGPEIVHIAPTRALVADLVARLQGPVGKVGGVIGERTSDRKTWRPGKYCSVLVTTPESFDSVLSSYPACLGGVKAVVLDDIHLLEGTPRGFQLLCTVNRLQRLRDPEKLQIVLASATIPDPRSFAERWTGSATVIESEGIHDLQMKIVYFQEDEWMHLLGDALSEFQAKKILVFCNSRRDSENLSRGLRTHFKDDGWVFYTHHSNIDVRLRKKAEREFKQSSGPIGVCTTSTMEIGIDIGDVDCIVLYHPPFSLNSFLQRIGRGCRRTNFRRVIGIAASPLEAKVFEALTTGSRAGISDGSRTPPLIGAALQQSGAAFKTKFNLHRIRHGAGPIFLHRDALFSFFKSIASALGVSSDTVSSRFANAVLITAETSGLLQEREFTSKEGPFIGLVQGDNYHDITEKVSFHVVFSSEHSELPLIDVSTQQVIGSIAPGNLIKGQAVQFAGKGWEILDVGKRHVAARKASRHADIPIFSSSNRGFYTDRVSEFLGYQVARDWVPGQVLYFKKGRDYHYVHFLGEQLCILLVSYLRDCGMEVLNYGPFIMLTGSEWHHDYIPPSPRKLMQVAIMAKKEIEAISDFGSDYSRLGEALQEFQLELAFDYAHAAKRLAGLSFKHVSHDCLQWGAEKYKKDGIFDF